MTDLGGPPSAPTRRRARATTRAIPALDGLRILVVDDDLGVCQSLRDLLTQEGCDVARRHRRARGAREARDRGASISC